MLRTNSILCSLLAISLIVGCGDDSNDNSVAASGGVQSPAAPGTPPADFAWPAQTKVAVETYAKVVSANYLDALQKAQPEFGIQILTTLSICLSWIITEGLLMAIFSTTLGKWSFNIKTSKINGIKIDILSALKRSFLVVVGNNG